MILEFTLSPIISIFGIVANFLIIYILKMKENQKDFKEKMYFYIYYNSLSNLVILVIDHIGYINKCSLNGIGFCPIIRETIAAQYIFIILNFLNDFLGFCSNFTLFMFSLERYSKSFNSIPTKLTKVIKFFNKHFFKIIFLFGSILNFCKLFEYKINEVYDKLNFPLQLDATDFIEKQHCTIFFSFLFLTQLFSNFIIQIINLVIDILMFNNYKKALKEKAKISSVSQNMKTKNSSNEKRLLRLIISFAMVNFFLRLPEFIVFIILKYYKLVLSNKFFTFLNSQSKYDLIDYNAIEYVCSYKQNCEKLFKSFQVLFKLSYLTNIFILCFMNKIFRNKLDAYALRMKKNLRCNKQ